MTARKKTGDAPETALQQMKRLREEFGAKAAKATTAANDHENMARRARDEASEMQRKQETLTKAMLLLMDNEAQQEAAHQKALAEKAFAALSKAKVAGKEIVFLIDGSGSMASTPVGHSPAPIKAALSMAESVQELLEAKGVKVSALLWGGAAPVAVDLKDKRMLEKSINGLCGGSDLSPALRALPASSTSARHVLIVSDGDIHDRESSKTELKNILESQPQTTVDVLMIYPHHTVMSDMARLILNLNVPDSRKPAVLFANEMETLTPLVQGLISQRLTTEPAKPVKTPTPPGRYPFR